MTSSSSSASSSSSSSRSSSPEPQPKSKALKRKHQEAQAESSDDSSSDDSDDSSSESEEEPVKRSKKKKDAKVQPLEDGAEPTKEEPVLSHAERRRQKRLAKQKAAEGDDSEAASKKRKLADGSASTEKDDKPKARQNSVWVGNMSFKTTQDDLKRFFGECGEITRVNMPTKPRSRPNVPLENRGFAYVDFATLEAKAAAIARSEQPLIGRKLLIKDGDNFEGRPAAPGADLRTADPSLAHRIHSKTAQKILRQQKQPPAPTLFIGNLPFETTEDGLKELFEKHHEQETKRASGKDDKKGKHDKVKEEESDDEGDKKDDKESDGEKYDEGKAQEKGKGKITSKKDEFILRVRMGTFEDSGACKGFAFIDFSSIDNATSALINIKNHSFNGRELKVEYAGVDAVRRGAAKHLVPAAADGKGGKGKGEGGRPFKPRGPKPPKEPYHDKEVVQGEGVMDVDEPVSAPPAHEGKPSRSNRPPKREFDDKRKGPRSRPTPGAALALAKRETAAIMPSQGKKTTF